MIRSCCTVSLCFKTGFYRTRMTYNGGLPASTWPKPFVRAGPYPNLYRDEKRRSGQDKVFAYTDYIACPGKDKGKTPNYDKLKGGLRRSLELPWNYLLTTDEEDDRETFSSSPWDSVSLPFTTKRSHVRLGGIREDVYVPSIRPSITLPSYTGNFIYNVYAKLTRPDAKFIRETQEALMKWMVNTENKDYQVTAMNISTDVINIRFFPPDFRATFIRFLTRTIKKQKNLEILIFEDAFLPVIESTRILLAISLHAGQSLRELYLTNLYFPYFLPQENIGKLETFRNEKVTGDESKESLRGGAESLKMKPMSGRSSESQKTLLTDDCFICTFRKLSHLTVLKVNYSWVATNNGLPLLTLECLRTGILEKLIILMMPSEYPELPEQTISYQTWLQVLRMCPKLELELILPNHKLSDFDFKNILARSMPLTSIMLGNLYPNGGANYRKPWFSNTMRYLRTNFEQSLKNIEINVWRPSCRVDLVIAKLLLGCPFLQTFVYRGEIDQQETIRAICEFLISEKNKTKLKEIGLYALDDPCRPNGWNESMAHFRERYTEKCADRNILLTLGIWKL